LDPSIMAAMRLPQKAAAYGSPAQLLTDIALLFKRYAGLDDQWARLAAFFPLASWVIEGLSRAPQLRIVGESCLESSQLMRLMGCLCRHPLELTEVDVAGLFSLPVGMNPTLLIRQPQLRGPVLRLLNAMSEGGLHVRQGRLIDFHLPVATFSQSASDIPRTGAVVEIPITPTNQQVPTLEGSTEREIAPEFQDRLFGFRVDWLSRVNASAFDAPELAFPMRQVARSFGACVPDDPSLQSELVATLRDGDASERLERSTSLEATVVEALLFFAHDAERRDAVHVGEITTAVNEIRRGAASPRRLNRERSGAFCEHSVSAQKTSTAPDEGYFSRTGFGSPLTASRGISKYPPCGTARRCATFASSSRKHTVPPSRFDADRVVVDGMNVWTLWMLNHPSQFSMQNHWSGYEQQDPTRKTRSGAPIAFLWRSIRNPGG
jgi:hypothetical protein